MSICPDKIVYSEYVDGELPSPWKEKLESHINSCKDCISPLDDYIMIHKALACDVNIDLNKSYEKLKLKLKYNCNSSIPSDVSNEPTNLVSFWHNTVRVPMSVVAAAVLLLFFLPAFFLFSSKSSLQQSNIANIPSYGIYSTNARNMQKVYNTSHSNEISDEFSASISDFIQMYMPSSDNSAEFIIIKVPSPIFNTADEVYDMFSNDGTVIKTKKLSE